MKYTRKQKMQLLSEEEKLIMKVVGDASVLTVVDFSYIRDKTMIGTARLNELIAELEKKKLIVRDGIEFELYAFL